MLKRKTYLIASLLDECDTNDLNGISCDTVKPIEIINNNQCQTLRKFDREIPECSDKREEGQSVALKCHGMTWRRALPMPINRNQIQHFLGNGSSQYLLYRMPAQTHLQALSPYSMPCLSQLMTSRYQFMQMQQAAVQQLSSTSSSSSLSTTSPSSSSPSSTLATASNQQISTNQTSLHQQQRLRLINKQNQSAIKKYRCDICDKTFSRSNTLVTHKRIHTGEKPFRCDHCGRAFRQPGNLTRHRLTHTMVKPYICSICGKAFNRASNLHTHMRTHSQISY